MRVFARFRRGAHRRVQERGRSSTQEVSPFTILRQPKGGSGESGHLGLLGALMSRYSPVLCSPSRRHRILKPGVSEGVPIRMSHSEPLSRLSALCVLILGLAATPFLFAQDHRDTGSAPANQSQAGPVKV